MRPFGLLSRIGSVLPLMLLACASHAQGTARSMDLETSVRAAGMGGASAGVWWGEPGVWGNPASLAEATGIRWIDGHTQLLPGLASDVSFDTRRLLVGGGGFGFSFMGSPIEGLGKLRLDYGTSELTDPFGNPVGTFRSYEEVEAWGMGFSPFRVFDALRRLAGHGEPDPRPYDIAVGLQRKHTVVAILPPSLGGTASGDTWDVGATGRFTLLPGTDPDLPLEFDVSGGISMLNADDEEFDFGFDRAPPTRTRRIGLAMHAATRSPWSGGRNLPLRLFVGELRPLEVGVAFDSDRNSAGGKAPFYTVQHFGLEMTLLGVLTGRYGHYSDRAGQIVDDTFGYGVRLPIGPFGAVAYDHATVPQANGSGLPDVQRRAWSVWVDPVRIVHAARAARDPH